MVKQQVLRYVRLAPPSAQDDKKVVAEQTIYPLAPAVNSPKPLMQ